jgi:eukaryotic-like serine/threonine-protein kinase
MPLAAGVRLGPYEVIAPLGSGGMGEVYRARDTRLGRDVAIKVLHADVAADPERLARFEREARAVSALNHPNIVTLYEIGTSDSGPYLVLERVEGHSLRDLVATGPLPLRQLTTLGAQIAAGLAKAHAAGIVHRDLKPENVMVTEDGFAKILDFGLARLVLPDVPGDEVKTETLAGRTASGIVLGTLGYLSPEQAAGKPVDFRADQFALGALLYEMSTGTRPFKRDTTLETLTATIRDEPDAVQSLRADLPAQLAWLIERCLAKNPDDRYASTKDLARDLSDVRDRLSEILKGAAVESATASARARRPWLRFGAFVALLLLAAVTGYAIARQMGSVDEPPAYRPLTFRRGLITGARFSPDGKTIYYSMTQDAEPSRVFVTRLDGADSRPLDLPPGILLSVSSKNELAVLLTTGRNPGTSSGTLVRVPALGGTPRALRDDVFYADWAPDGERLAVVTGQSVEFPIGTPLRRRPFWARVAPTGDRLALLAGGIVDITDLQGKPLLTQREPLIWGFAWTPDGREVWYTASESGGGADRALFALSLTGKRRLVARIPGALNVHDVGPDGRSALVSTGAGWVSISAFHASERREQSLDLLGRSQLVGLSDDGRWLLAGEERDVRPGVYLRSTDGRETIFLGVDRPIGLSPDRAWALVLDRANSARAKLLPTGAGQPRDVPFPEGVEISAPPPRWSSDGRRLFAAFRPRGQQTATFRIWLRDGDAPWRAVTSEGVLPAGLVPETFAVSPDGRTVAMRDASGAVTLFPTENNAPRRIAEERGTPIHWSADGRYLFIREDELPARIFRRDLRSGRRELWREVAPADLTGVVGIMNVFLSHDGENYVYQYLRGLNDLYLAYRLR